MADDNSRVDREAILARRRRFVTAALTGLTTSTLATACPCLKVAPSPAPEPQPGTTSESTGSGSTSEAMNDATSDAGAAEAKTVDEPSVGVTNQNAAPKGD